MRRSVVRFGVCFIVLTFCSFVEAQEPKKIPRLGIIRTGAPPDPLTDALREGLRELGYIEGKNILIEYRWAEGKSERLQEIAADLVRSKVDLIVAAGPGPILAAKQATGTIPIVMPVVINPVGSGLVDSLARPGGNLTGLSSQTDELPGKWMELLKEILPKVSRVAVMVDAPNDIGQTKAAKDAARPWNINLQVLIVSGPADFEIAF